MGANSDQIGEWSDAGRAFGLRSTSACLYGLYEAWAIANGEAVWSHKAFGSAMLERGYRTKKSGVTFYQDIKLIMTAGVFREAAADAASEMDEEVPN